jgi:hypothetical protein
MNDTEQARTYSRGTPKMAIRAGRDSVTLLRISITLCRFYGTVFGGRVGDVQHLEGKTVGIMGYHSFIPR